MGVGEYAGIEEELQDGFGVTLDWVRSLTVSFNHVALDSMIFSFFVSNSYISCYDSYVIT